MASIEEELIILEDDEEAKEAQKEDQKETPSLTKKENKLTNIILIIAIIIVILFFLMLAAFISFEKKEKVVIEPENEAKTILENIKNKKEPPKNLSKIQRLTLEAKRLYENGKIDEALKIYKEISFFHKSLAKFNLGVTLMKEKKYKKAIENFLESFKHDDLKFESSLNIALCYKALKDKENFKKYLYEADRYIITKYDTPLFNYYLGVLEYYKDMPFESLVVLRKYESKYYKQNANLIKSKEYTYIKNYDLAINSLLNTKDKKYYFTVGELYAKNEEFTLAAKYFQNSLNEKLYPIQSRLALALVQIKLGLFESCSRNLKVLIDNNQTLATKYFPIKVFIKKSLHDPVLAQKEFQKSIFNNIRNRFGLLFYYAPYKLYDPKQSNTIIEKGAKEFYINNTKSAYKYLYQADSISEINLQIIKGLKLLEKHKVYEANNIFKNLIKKYPNHSILHYNLALTYSNISDFPKATKHFKKSYMLDKKNYLAIFFAAITSELQHKEFDTTVLENILKFADKDTYNELNLIYKIAKNDTALDIDPNTPKNPFRIVINLIASNMIGDKNLYLKYAKELKELLPKDLVANIIYVDQISQGKSIKEYAKAVQENLVRKNLDMSSLIYGETFARELYIRILNIAGSINFIKSYLENEYITNKNQIALNQSLAYTYIYTKEYEKSYQLYNKIIDTFKVNDAHTLFLGSVAAIGANHHANAIALLELANLEDKKFYESRYGLGLLYQEAKNFEGAAIQYLKIGNSGFKSKYFDFDLK